MSRYEERELPEMTGQFFGRWQVIGKLERWNRSITVMCLCECGNQRLVVVRALKNGQSTSCGCAKRERSRLDQKPAEAEQDDEEPAGKTWTRDGTSGWAVDKAMLDFARMDIRGKS